MTTESQKRNSARRSKAEQNDLMTLTDVAKQLGRSPQTIARWINDGLLSAIRLPSGLRVVRRSEVNKFLKGSALDAQVE
ncbi:MAG TPA: helix-turn-helix domain-containing protein [Planctomycetaceae bacterium]|nr:helix-turn-helix domain-containing protein [Planctomycetaceae bacterium]